jgi:hypothetical protein
MTKKVHLHVGTPKTGTSYLQHVLFHNRRLLRLKGVSYPADRFDAHFLAALDLMRMPWGGLEAQAIGRWGRLAEKVRDFHGTSIISHEILATASRAHIGRALGSHGPRLAVPKRHEEWVRRRAERLREELTAGRYSLHGDLALLVPASAGAQPPSDEAVLEVALRTLLHTKEAGR